MLRKSICKIPEEFSSEEKIIHKTYDFEIITPMFGGDSVSWMIDTNNPVRGQSVKGMLRFWWRTMQSETDHEQLLYTENKVWGGKTADNDQNSNRCQSPVKLSVVEQKSSHQVFENDGNVIPKYVSFPLESFKDNAHVITKLSFKLQISYPLGNESDVTNTLKLWCLFGGVGARTRRGTGSLYCKELLNEFNDEDDIKSFIGRFGSQQSELLYPRVVGSTFAIKKEASAETAGIWHGMLSHYGEYRQGRGVGRGNGQGNRPGRSYWPEPDAIRRITRRNSPNHQPEHLDGIWFPRAAFGLPILTEFKNSDGDPREKILLEPNIGTGERWPSPVIMKVIKLPNGNVYKAALVLNQEFPERLKLKGVRPEELPASALPTNTAGKTMKKNDKLDGRGIYKHLIDFLHLKVVK